MSPLFPGRRPSVPVTAVHKKLSNLQQVSHPSLHTEVPVTVATTSGNASPQPTAPSSLAPFTNELQEKQVNVLVQKLEDKVRLGYLL